MAGKKNPIGTVITLTPGRLYRVKLMAKVLADGRQSLFLSHYRGEEKKTYVEYLNIIIKTNPKAKEDRDYNSEQMKLALMIREKRESFLKHSQEALLSPHLKRINFIDYCKAYLAKYPNRDIRLVKGCLVKFYAFIGKDFILPAEIDKELVEGFKKYLLSCLNGETPSNYYTKFKKLCKQAVKDRVLNDDPSEGISMPRDTSVKKAILSYEEIAMLARTPCRKPEIKRAFLFACNTALGFDEMKNLKWADVDLTAKKLTITRGKVRTTSNKSINHLDLNSNALALLGKAGSPEEAVFKLKTFESTIKNLKEWVKASGVTKNVTWHSARHSVATNLLINGTDLKTVSSILTHSTIKHTTKYLHLVDERKKAAMDSMPDYDLEQLP
jgi:site-specific recombinase XerD